MKKDSQFFIGMAIMRNYIDNSIDRFANHMHTEKRFTIKYDHQDTEKKRFTICVSCIDP